MPRIRLIIDALMFLCIAALAGIGFLLKYVFLSGQEAQIVYGARVEQFLWGLEEHDWGTIHLIIGLVMAALLVFHIILNWNTIIRMFQRLVNYQKIRRTIALIFAFIIITIVVFPFLITPEVKLRDDEGGGQWQGQGQRQSIPAP
jgi:hypothetical protein